MKNKIGQVIFGGLVLSLSVIFPTLWWLSLVGLIPLVRALTDQVGNKKSLSAFGLGLLFGLAYLLPVTSYLFNVLPLDWVGIESDMISFTLVFIGWLYLSLGLSLFVGVWAAVFTKWRFNNHQDIWWGAGLWVVGEYLSAWFFSAAVYGDGGLWGPNWTIGFLGYNLAPTSLLLPLAGIGGVWLLSFFAVATNLAIYSVGKILIKNWLIADHQFVDKRIFVPLIIPFLLISLSLGYRAIIYSVDKNELPKLTVAVVTTYQPSYSSGLSVEVSSTSLPIKKNLLEKHFKSASVKPDIIIFPEDSRFLLALAQNGGQDFLRDIFGADKQGLIIDSARIIKGKSSPRLEFLYLDNLTQDIYFSQKSFLMPLGEYLPELWRLGFRLIGLEVVVNGFRFNPGDNRNLAGGIDWRGERIEAAACSEIMLPFVYNQSVDRGVGFIINSASHSLFNGSDLLYRQSLNMARVRAMETNRYLVYSSNFAPSFILDNHGQIVAEATSNQIESIIQAEIPLIKDSSWYQKWYRLVASR